MSGCDSFLDSSSIKGAILALMCFLGYLLGPSETFMMWVVLLVSYKCSGCMFELLRLLCRRSVAARCFRCRFSLEVSGFLDTISSLGTLWALFGSFVGSL